MSSPPPPPISSFLPYTLLAHCDQHEERHPNISLQTPFITPCTHAYPFPLPLALPPSSTLHSLQITSHETLIPSYLEVLLGYEVQKGGNPNPNFRREEDVKSLSSDTRDEAILWKRLGFVSFSPSLPHSEVRRETKVGLFAAMVSAERTLLRIT